MTSKQLERKVRQLYSRKRLVETVEELEEAIKSFMALEGKTEIHTEKFIIRLVDGTTGHLRETSKIDPNQLTLNFSTNPNHHKKGGHYK